MLNDSLIKSNFIGRDGFRWWVGQIPPEKDMGGQLNGSGWGNRYKVRIMGYHPFTDELPNEDLPWAIVMLPTTSGSGAGGKAESVKISQGDIVFGFFLDGDNAQIPVINGILGRTGEVSSAKYTSPFVPFTGYNDKAVATDAYIVKNESNEGGSSESQKAPRDVSRNQAQNIGSNERPASSANGLIVNIASKKPDSTLKKIETDLKNLVHKIKEVTTSINVGISSVTQAIDGVQKKIDKFISETTESIKKHASKLVANMTKGLFKKLSPVIKSGLKTLYKIVYNTVLAATGNEVIAHKAGVLAQNALVVPITAIKNALPCIVNKVIDTLGSGIANIVSGIANNVKNMVSCIVNQAIGGIANMIIGGITKFLGPLMGAIDKILFGFNFISFLRSNFEGLLGIIGALSCAEKESEDNGAEQYEIGKGPVETAAAGIQSILEVANTANNAVQTLVDAGQEVSQLTQSLGVWDFNNPSVSVPGFKSALGSCYTGPPLNCITGVKIFGGGGVGGAAKAIFGSIIGEEGTKTASIIGIDLTNPGSGYIKNPMVEITDNCNQGYGAIAKASINPTTGEIDDIYIISEGEKYPVDPSIDDNYIIDEVVPIEPGVGYKPDDTIVVFVDNDNPEEEGDEYVYSIVVDDNGSIVKVLPINNDNRIVKDLPSFIIQTETGYGAVLKARLKLKPKGTQKGQLKQVIDCIS